MRSYLLSSTLTLLLLTAASSLSCICSPTECEEVSEEICPDGAGTVWDPCKCCRVCARVEGEPCGGPHGFHGTCAKGLECVIGTREAGIGVLDAHREGICIRHPGSDLNCPNPKIASGCNIVDNMCQCEEQVTVCGDQNFSFSSQDECQVNLAVMLAHDTEISGGSVCESLLHRAFANKNRNVWLPEWKALLTKKIRWAVILWQKNLIEALKYCRMLKVLEVVLIDVMDFDLVFKLPKSINLLDFDGCFIKRGHVLDINEEMLQLSWLPQAEEILRNLRLLRENIPEFSNKTGLIEVHLGVVPASSKDLQIILKSSPNLKLLRHYQLVKALYEMHSNDWKTRQKLPTYKLRNLDVDFSHVIRHTMSPKWVLSPDALQLAGLLCPKAEIVRIRFDCSTPNDVLATLTNLKKIKEFSAVCVSSGERTLLDFSDMVPILEKFGSTSLTTLELKVIEDIEIHEIIEKCPKLEILVLSGCGYVTPATCSNFNCKTYRPGTFKKLRLLFFADGDDFSWDHGVPDCFWKASLLPSGLFLEFPRISAELTGKIFRSQQNNIPFPKIQTMSVCRFNELTLADIQGLIGCQSGRVAELLRFLKLSDCERIDLNQGRYLADLFLKWDLPCVVQID